MENVTKMKNDADKPTEAQVLAAIEVIKAHLDADWISCCEKDHAFGCASCQAVMLKKTLDGLASWFEVPGDG